MSRASGNKASGNKNTRGKVICGSGHPHEKNWVCSLAAGHVGDECKGYWGHQVTMRTKFYDDWYRWNASSEGRQKDDVAHDDDVAAALASIQATMSSRLPPQTVAEKVAETNKALAEKYDGTGVSVQIHVQNNMKDELDAVIERLTALRDSLT